MYQLQKAPLFLQYIYHQQFFSDGHNQEFYHEINDYHQNIKLEPIVGRSLHEQSNKIFDDEDFPVVGQDEKNLWLKYYTVLQINIFLIKSFLQKKIKITSKTTLSIMRQKRGRRKNTNKYALRGNHLLPILLHSARPAASCHLL